MSDFRNIFCILRRMRWRETPCNAPQKLSRYKIFADHIYFAFIYCTAKIITTTPCARVAILALCLGLACMPGCAGGGKKKSPNLSDRAAMVTGGSSGLKDETITLQQLDAISNAFADRYYTLMLAASERVMYNNPSVEQRRLMNELRLQDRNGYWIIQTHATACQDVGGFRRQGQDLCGAHSDEYLHG